MLSRTVLRSTSQLAKRDLPRVSARCMSTSAESQTDFKGLRELGNKHITKGVGRITEGIMLRGEGSYVKYDDGRKMLDFTCGIGVTNLGEWW